MATPGLTVACAVARTPRTRSTDVIVRAHIRQAEFLDHFASVPVPVGRERADHSGPFRVVRAGIALRPAFGGTHLEFDNDLFVQVDQAGFDQRQ